MESAASRGGSHRSTDVNARGDMNDDGNASQAASPRPPQLTKREESELIRWWHNYAAANGKTRLAMTRDQLDTISPGENVHTSYFPEAILELESQLPSRDYVAFLEEIRESHHDVFRKNSDWFTRSMLHEYLACDRKSDVDRAVAVLSSELPELSQPFFSLVSTLRLAGRAEAAQSLLDAAAKKLNESELQPWAVNDINRWEMFRYLHECVCSGGSKESYKALLQAAVTKRHGGMPRQDPDWRTIIRHLSGQSEKTWNWHDFSERQPNASENLCRLGFDFQYWLTTERDITPVAADEFRLLVMALIDDFQRPLQPCLTSVTRGDIEPFVASKLSYLSLAQIQAPATLVALKNFYDFLLEVDLITRANWIQAQTLCDRLLADVEHAFGMMWPICRFLDDYLDARASRPPANFAGFLTLVR